MRGHIRVLLHVVDSPIRPYTPKLTYDDEEK